MNVRKQKDSDGNQFEKDCAEILLKLKSVTEDSRVIKRAVEQNLNEDEMAKLMTLIRERMPKAIQTLGQIHQFLTRYGYKNNVGNDQENFRTEDK